MSGRDYNPEKPSSGASSPQYLVNAIRKLGTSRLLNDGEAGAWRRHTRENQKQPNPRQGNDTGEFEPTSG